MGTVIIVGGVNNIPYTQSNCDYIGVDYGVQICLNHSIDPKMGIGDFDSSNIEKYKNIPLNKFPKEKDETDLELAILFALEKYDKIILTCCLGGRIDHTLYNIKLASKYNVEIKDLNQHIYVLEKGKHKIIKKNRYFSFFALKKTCISLIGFKYPLNNSVIEIDSFKTISNEIVESFGEIIIEYGKILCINCD